MGITADEQIKINRQLTEIISPTSKEEWAALRPISPSNTIVLNQRIQWTICFWAARENHFHASFQDLQVLNFDLVYWALVTFATAHELAKFGNPKVMGARDKEYITFC